MSRANSSSELLRIPHLKLAGRPLRTAMAILVVAGLIGGGMAHLLTNASRAEAFIVLVFLGAGLLGLQILRNWRFGLTSFFAWIAVEDFVRKHLGNQIVLYGVKDLMIAMTYASYLVARIIARGGEGAHKDLMASPAFRSVAVPLGACLALAVAECFNPQIEHPAIPFIGLRMSFFYVPLLFLGYTYFNSEVRLRRFLTFALLVGSGVALLGLLQVVFGLDLFNPQGFVPGLRLRLVRIAPESQWSVPRPTSVFVDAGRFAQYLFILFFLGLGALAYWRACVPRPSGARLLFGAFVLVSAGLVVSAQRAALILAAFALIVLMGASGGEWIASAVARWRRRSTWPVGQIVVGIALAISGFALLFPERILALFRFLLETLSPLARETEVTWRPKVYGRDIVTALMHARLFGHGTGTASLGLQYLYGLDDLYEGATWSPYRVEGGYASLIWEWGIIGVVLWIWWTAALGGAAFLIARQLRGSRFFGLATALALFLVLFHFPYFFLGLPVYQNYVNNAYHWFLCGLLFRLPRLTRSSDALQSGISERAGSGRM